MRLTAIILMISFVHLSASTRAQKISIAEKNAPLEHILKEIRKQSGYDIIYDLNLVLDTKPVSINVNQANVFEALQRTLSGQQLTFTVDGRTIVIKERGVIEKITDMVLDYEVKIQVRDSLNLPIAGANVYNKTINKMYTTDKNGEVLIKDVPANGYVLQISYIGFKGEEIFVDRKTKTYWVTMKEATAGLQEINVISNGYQTISRERAAGAYAIVSAKEIQETPALNLMERLEGKVAGVKFDIKNNTIQIRGVNSFAGASGTPLIVLDGFPMMDPSDRATVTKSVSGNAWGNSIISSINIADIEQITFLKDASATSIWGSRAANGVVVIETKKGKKAAPTLNASYTLGISKNPSMSSLKWMNSAQYIDLEQEMVNKNLITDPAAAPPGNEFYTLNNSEATELMFKFRRGTITAAQRDAALAELASRNGLAQIEDKLLQNAVNHQYSLSYSGATESSTYYVSGSYNKDIPIYRSNYADNAFFNASTSTEFFNKRITLRTLVNYQYSKSQYNPSAVNALSVSTTAQRPYELLVDANDNPIRRNIIFRDAFANSLIAKGYLPFTYNAVDELNYSNSIAKNNVFRITAGLNGKITKWLNADLSVSNQRQIGNSYTLDEIDSYAGRLLVNTGTVVTSGKPVYNVPYGGRYITYSNTASDITFRGQLNSDFKLSDDHHFNVIAGTEMRETETSNTSETRYGFDADTRTIGIANPTTQYMTMYGYTQSLGQNLGALISYRKRYLSYYGNASYSFREKYFLTASARMDDYTLQGLDRRNRTKPFWSVGLRWNAQNEEFLKPLEWLNSLSVRATIGTAGVVPQGGSNITVISVSGSDPRTGQPVASIDNPGNSELSWETTRMANLGFDFGLFKGRLGGSFDVYTKRTNGILASFPFNQTYGWGSLFFNTGTLSGNGYEFSLNGDVLRAGMFTWKSVLNFGYTNNIVTEQRYVNNASNIAGTGSTIEGEALGTLYVYRWAGLDNRGQSQIYDRNNNIINNTTNLTNAFTKEDLVKVGRLYAPYSSGFNHTFTYGQLQLGVQITGYFGHVFLKNSITNSNYPTSDQFAYFGVLGRQEDLAYRWRNAGDEATTNVPGITNVNFNSINRYRFSDILVRKADNIRLQQVSLGYTVPKRFLPRNTIKNISISANVRNLGILWRANKEGIDPEYINTGNYGSVTPTPSYVFGINATF
ncbi:SusC/RagA family TonB-linked outer membrane protein [Pedobacter ureilyticus]|uniref:SusC/RagA family TonB-linked outer membrane protein n=1 Tax=Pedobacter ureilyticus TaxID=1393051 RepID=A0ABW9JDB1_9SPHI|nr:SusC/RagA family TonB-linked outer membrane protein [Pedobacter helvus]